MKLVLQQLRTRCGGKTFPKPSYMRPGGGKRPCFTMPFRIEEELYKHFASVLIFNHMFQVLFTMYKLLSCHTDTYIYIYSESTEPIDAVNILPLLRFEPTTSATPPSTIVLPE